MSRTHFVFPVLLLGLVACGGGGTTTTGGETGGGTAGGERESERETETDDEEFPLNARVDVPGTGISMRAPRGSELLATAAGFIHRRREIQIIIAEAHGPDEMIESFRQGLIGDDEEETETEEVTLSGVEATLGVGAQDSHGTELELVWLFARDGDRAVAVIGAYDASRSERYRGLVRAAVTSAEWDRTRPIDAEQALGFGVRVEGLELDHSSSSPLVYRLAGAASPPSPAEPQLFVMALPVAVRASQRSEVCEDLLTQAGPVAEDSVRERHDIETDELEGCEVEGLQENEDPDEGEPASATTYAAVVFHDDGTFMVAGIVDASQRDTWIARFRDASRTLHRVRAETDDEEEEDEEEEDEEDEED